MDYPPNQILIKWPLPHVRMALEEAFDIELPDEAGDMEISVGTGTGC